jgi:hypothetical protein
VYFIFPEQKQMNREKILQLTNYPKIYAASAFGMSVSDFTEECKKHGEAKKKLNVQKELKDGHIIRKKNMKKLKMFLSKLLNLTLKKQKKEKIF